VAESPMGGDSGPESSTLFGEFKRMARTSGAVGGIAARMAGSRLLGIKTDRGAHAEDLRAILGLEWFGTSRARGNVEIGYVFDRNIMYRNGAPTIHPGNTMMFQANFAF